MVEAAGGRHPRVQSPDEQLQLRVWPRHAGAIVNAVLISGTNQVHGDAWEFIRNDALDGTDFFLNAGGQKKGEFRRNQFGFTIGGPVWIPHVYNGKNKTFIFGDYEGTRIRQAVPFVDSVPTLNERNSGFTNYQDLITAQSGTQKDLLGRTFPLGAVFDPATTRTVTAGQIDPVTGISATGSGYVRDPFAGNIIPVNRLDPVAVKLLSLFPAPNNPGIANNMVTNPIKSINNSTMDIRLDHNFSEKDQTFLRVSMAWEPQFLPTPLGGLVEGASNFAEGNQNNDVMNLGWSETHIFNASTVNEIRVGYSHVRTKRLQPFGDQGGLNAANGIQGIPDSPPNGGLTQINITGLNQLLGGHNNLAGLVDEINGNSQFHDNFSRSSGAPHSLKSGVRKAAASESSGVPARFQFPHGYFAYSGQYTTVPGGNAASTGIAQFAIEPVASTVANGINYEGGANQVEVSPLGQEDYRRPYYGTFLQDNWAVLTTQRLTVNAGDPLGILSAAARQLRRRREFHTRHPIRECRLPGGFAPAEHAALAQFSERAAKQRHRSRVHQQSTTGRGLETQLGAPPRAGVRSIAEVRDPRGLRAVL